MLSRTNAAERSHWNDPSWVSVWLKREELTRGLSHAPLEILELTEGDAVLDVGCGRGITTTMAAGSVGAHGSALGVDLSAQLVRLARKRAASEGVTNVRFLESDAQHHAFGRKFSALTSHFGTMFFSNPVAAFQNLRAYAEREARLSFSCWRTPEENPWSLRQVIAPYVAQQREREAARKGAFSLCSRDTVQTILRDAGWSRISCVARDSAVVVGREALFDPSQISFAGIQGPQAARAEIAVERRLTTLQRRDGRYDAPLAFWLVSARA